MQSEDILVLGSGPQTRIVKKEFKKIYASNASIIKCKEYLSHNVNIEIISVVTEKGLLSDIPTQENIREIKPNRIVVRKKTNKDLPDFNFKFETLFFSNVEQYEFQKKFFKNANIFLPLAEIFYGNTFNEKLRHLINIFKYKKSVMGISTGFYTILLALFENPNSQIYINGITMSNSKHFYELIGKENKIMTRHKVDNFMIKLLFKKFKINLYTTNLNFSKLGKINYFENVG